MKKMINIFVKLLMYPNHLKCLFPSLNQENNTVDKIDTSSTALDDTTTTLLSPTPVSKTASEIVKEECKLNSDNLNNSGLSVVSRLHEKTFSRAEYSSNYGNLI